MCASKQQLRAAAHCVECAVGNLLYGAYISLSSVHSGKMLAKKNVVSIVLCGSLGDLLYLRVMTLEGNVVHVTASSSGFFLSK